MYSSTSLKRNGKPYLIANSSCFKKSGSLKVHTLRLLASSFFLIQLRACCCGSIQSGNRLALVVRIPFCIDSSSGGRLSDVHLGKRKYHSHAYYAFHVQYANQIKNILVCISNQVHPSMHKSSKPWYANQVHPTTHIKSNMP